MRDLARVFLSKLRAPVLMAGIVPVSFGASSDAVPFVFLGKVWGVAMVFWGACLVLVAAGALIRHLSTDSPDEVGRLHTRIRRFRFTRPTPAPRP